MPLCHTSCKSVKKIIFFFWPCIGAMFFVIIVILMVKISFCKCVSSHVGDVKLKGNPYFIVYSGGFTNINSPKKGRREQS